MTAPRLLKGLTLSLLVAIPFSVLPTFAAAPIKAGSACTKAGNTKIYQGKKFTCVKSGRKLVWNKGVSTKSASPATSPASSSATDSAPSPAATLNFVESPKLRNPEECKLADARRDGSFRLDDYQRSAGFPLQGAVLPTQGKIRFVTFFVDFSDAQGTDADVKFFREQERIFVDWFDAASYGKLKVEIATSDVWFRAKKKSSDLVLPQNNYGSHPLIAQELVELTGKSFDWRNIDAFMVHFPRVNSTNLRDAQLGRSVTLKFPHGEKQINYQFYGLGTNKMAEQRSSKYPNYFAQLWVHENLHDLGLTLHAPGNGFNTGIAQNEASYSLTLNAWDMFKLGWIEDSQVFCGNSSTSSIITRKLTPLEEEGAGDRIIVIPVSNFEALVVESRRPTGLSKSWPKTMVGVFVYRVNTSLVTDRSSEFTSSKLDSGNNPMFPKWAFYLPPDQRKIDATLPASKVDPEKFYQEWLIREGESVTSDGIRIKLAKVEKVDWIQISKA